MILNEHTKIFSRAKLDHALLDQIFSAREETIRIDWPAYPHPLPGPGGFRANHTGEEASVLREHLREHGERHGDWCRLQAASQPTSWALNLTTSHSPAKRKTPGVWTCERVGEDAY